jgi:hypothetical protein
VTTSAGEALARSNGRTTMPKRTPMIPAPGIRVRRGLRWIEQHARVAFDDARGKRGRMHGASSSDVAAALEWVREARKRRS